MAGYDLMEAGFNIADETINFGPRAISETGELFESVTVASLRNSKEADDNKPEVKAEIKDNKIFLQINESLKIFSNPECTSISFDSSFECLIDNYSINLTGEFILICLRSGGIHFIKLEKEDSDEAVLFSESYWENDDLHSEFFIGAFLEFEDDNSCQFLLIVRDGKVVRLVIPKNNVDSQPEYNIVKDFEFKILNVAYCRPYLLINGSKLVSYNVVKDSFIKSTKLSMKKLMGFTKKNFIALTEDGCLIYISSKTLQSCCIPFTESTREFNITSNETEAHLYKVTEKGEQGEVRIQLLTFPELSPIFSIKAMGNLFLVQPEYLNHECFYISENSGRMGELRFQKIVETVPEKLIERLLRRRNFDEAEKLAIQHNCSLEEIKKARAQDIVDQRESTSSDIKRLIEILESINDTSFKYKCINNVTCDSLEDTRDILNYGCNLNLSKTEKNDMEIKELQDTVFETMSRLNLFMALQNEDNVKPKIDEWSYFAHCNLIAELKIRLRKCLFDDCVLIYNRFDTEARLKLTIIDIEEILEILNTIPYDVQMGFLSSFIPLTLYYVENTMSLFVLWLENRMYYIESHFIVDFPENAIAFMQKAIKILKPDPFSNTTLQQQFIFNTSYVDELKELLNGLKLIKTLKDTYGIVIKLSDYMQGPRHLIRLFFNLEMHEDMYKDFIQEFLTPYILENKLNPDQIYLEEIQEIITCEEWYWIKYVPSIVTCIKSIKCKLEAVIKIMQVANLPWSQEVRDIAESMLQYDHELVQTIKRIIHNEPVYVVLGKPIYKLQGMNINTLEDVELVVKRIIFFKQPTMVDDIFAICTISLSIQTASVLLFNYFIRTGEKLKAMEIVDRLPFDDTLSTVRQLVLFSENIIKRTSGKGLSKLRANYYDVLDFLFCKMIEYTENDFDKIQLRADLNHLKALYEIERDFDIEVTLYDIVNPDRKKQILEPLISTLAQKFSDEEIELGEVLEKCRQISKYFDMRQGEILMRLCMKLDSFGEIHSVIGVMHLYDCEADTLCQTAVLVLRKLGYQQVDYLNMSDLNATALFSAQDVVPTDTRIIIQCLTICLQLLTQAVLKTTGVDCLPVVEVFNWVQSTYFLWKSTSYVKESLAFVQDFFVGTAKFIGQFNNPNTRYLTSDNGMPVIKEGDFMKTLTHLDFTVRNMCKEGQTLVAYKVLRTVENSLTYANNVPEEVYNRLLDCRKICAYTLLQQSPTSNMDIQFVSYFIPYTDYAHAWSVITSALKLYKRDINKLYLAAQLGLRVQNHFKGQEAKLCHSLLRRVKWYKAIENCQISYDTFFKSKSEVLAEKMITCHHLSMEQVIECCRDFKLPIETYLTIYLKRLLLDWKPEYEIKTNSDGNQRVVIKSSGEELLEKCKKVVLLLENKDHLYNILNTLFLTVNFYHYEVLMCIIRLLEEMKPKADSKKMEEFLNFLKRYTRVSKPSDAEREEWFTNFPDRRDIDELSEFRLAFTKTIFTKDIFNIIRPEVNIKTYKIWFNAIEFIPKYLNKDVICVYSIKNVKSSGSFRQDTKSSWILYPQLEDLIAEVGECVKYISNLEKATSVLYEFANSLPPGADQVQAAKLCYEYARRYKNQNEDEEVAKAFVKVEKYYYGISTSHILHINGLAEEKYLKLVTNPRELINELYMDDRILESADRLMLSCPDINKAVDQLGEFFMDIDIIEKRKELVIQWLRDENCQVGNVFKITNEDLAEIRKKNNLKRAIYICKNNDLLEWQAYLLREGLNGDSGKGNDSGSFRDGPELKKVFALKCFRAITDEKDIYDMTGLTCKQFMNYIDKLQLTDDLEELGFKYDIEKFIMCNKIELLLKLKACLPTNPSTVKTMGFLCMTFTIYDFRCWNLIISTTIKQKNVTQLKEYVYFFRDTTNCYYQQFYKDAWQFIIDQSFDFDSNRNKTLVENLIYLQSCHIINSLNLSNAFSACFENKRYEFAAMLLQYMPVDMRSKCAKDIIACSKNVLKDIAALSELGILGVTSTTSILKKAKEEMLES